MITEKTESKRHVFETLDGMRGVAAVCVAFMHGQVLFSVYPYSGFLAVDFFFVLSGFVISYAYEERLNSGMGPLRFAWIRLIRLYPMYILGVALALGARFVGGALHLGPTLNLDQMVAWPAFETFFLPVPAYFSPEANHMFPGLFPAWSLFFELVINIFYGLIVRHLTNRRLIVLMVIGACWLIEGTIVRGSVDRGGATTDGLYGLARVLYPFFTGVAIKRLYFSGRISFKVAAWPSIPILVGLLFLPVIGPYVVDIEILCVIVVFPALVLIFAYARAEGWQRALLLESGRLSYPIYILHAPVFFVVSRALPHLHIVSPIGQHVAGVAFIVITIAAASFLEKVYDRPIRAALARRMRARNPSPA